MPACQRMRHQVEIGHLQKGVDGRWLVLLASHPGAHLAELGGHSGIRFAEQAIAVVVHPLGQLVRAGGDLIGHLVDAEHPPVGVAVDQPLPERRAEIQTVVQVLCLDEDVGVQQIAHAITPSSRAAS